MPQRFKRENYSVISPFLSGGLFQTLPFILFLTFHILPSLTPFFSSLPTFLPLYPPPLSFLFQSSPYLPLTSLSSFLSPVLHPRPSRSAHPSRTLCPFLADRMARNIDNWSPTTTPANFLFLIIVRRENCRQKFN